MTASELQTGTSALVEDVLARAADPALAERFQRQLESIGFCRQPVRLHGRIDAIDLTTGEVRTSYSTAAEPDQTLLKCCGNRREAVCPSCARTYRGDAYQLVAAGLRGGKGVPAGVAGHPLLFLTLTAPGFGAVHTQRTTNGKPARCRPRRRAERCPHGVRLSCGEVHADDDPRLGEPLCHRCFDYERAILWNAMAPELWRRTVIQVRRELARLRGLTERELRRRVRVSYIKVAEYQHRGALHFHAVLRLDAAGEAVAPPHDDFDRGLLEDAIKAAVERVSVRSPAPGSSDGAPAFELRWGRQVDLRGFDVGDDGRLDARWARYLAKYATKSTEVVGGLMHPLTAETLRDLRVREHVRRLVECAWRLGSQEHLHALRLRRWAHALGFRGHCFTKSRRYPRTFGALRRARHAHVRERIHRGRELDPWGRPLSESASCEQSRFRFIGIGYRTRGDAWLAESARARAAEGRRIAHEELRRRWAAA